MATIYKHLSEAQREAFADLNVGDLLLARQVHRPHRDVASASEAEDSVADDESESQAEDEDVGEGELNEPSESESDENESASTNEELDESDHAEHIEDVDVAEQSANDDQDGASNASDQSQQSEPTSYPPTMFLVCEVTKDSEGEIKTIILVAVDYSITPDPQCKDDSYQLYGKQCVANTSTARLSELVSTATKPNDQATPSNFGRPGDFTYTARPTADEIRRLLFNSTCPASCDSGWLSSITALQGMVKNYTIPTTTPNVPAICPSCVGIDLMKEHQQLRAELEAFHRVANFSSIIEFYTRLNPRRRQLGYAYNQFDERDWGYYFDDMLSDEGDDEEDGSPGPNGNDRFQHWTEAIDPSNGARLRPASQATIDALPVKPYADVKVDDDAFCVVCHDPYQDEKLVVVLPCKHFFCEECGKQWLRSYDSCPACRARVPAVVVVDEKAAGGSVDSPVDDGGKEGEEGDGGV